uniref:Secreted RxLR effector peptide protein n=1 Tax=Haemonchus contortus TaxID=6289 RepID=A0A7I5E9D3_HAECO
MHPGMFLVFGVLLLTSSVLSKNDNLDTIYKAIKDIIGFDQNELMKIREAVIAKKFGKQDHRLDSNLEKRRHDFVQTAKSLPRDARRFMYSLIHSGLNPKSKRPHFFKSWNRLESKYRGKISKDSCSILLKKFPGLAKYKICTA